MTDRQTNDDAAFTAAFSGACQECIAEARRLRPRLLAADPTAAFEFGRAAGNAMSKAGATKNEGLQYAHRILAAVLAEPQA